MRRLGLCLLCLLLLISSLLFCQNSAQEPVLQIIFLDVGQGDSILLRTSEGDILIDAGTDAAQELLCLRLEQLGVTELALAVFTHPDEDHIGGADGVIRQFSPREIWVGAISYKSEAERLLSAAANACDVAIQTAGAGKSLSLGGVRISVLAPIGDVSAGGNDSSIVLRVQCGEIGAIFSGDAGSEVEGMLLDRYGSAQLACDLYKVGHHGSTTSSSAVFVQTMQPDYAVICCGAANSYGHPMGEVLARLEAVGATVLRTDLCGEIVFETDGYALICTDR